MMEPMERRLARYFSSPGEVCALSARIGVDISSHRDPLSAEGLLQYLLVDLAARRDAAGWMSLSRSVGEAPISDVALANDLEAMAVLARKGEWPDDLDEVWLRVRRSGGRWRVEFLLGPLDLRGAFDVERRRQHPLTASARLTADPGDSGLGLRVEGNGEGLEGYRVRIWHGVKSLARTLIPAPGHKLGSFEPVLMELVISDGGACEID